jgi:hypothetical protein
MLARQALYHLSHSASTPTVTFKMKVGYKNRELELQTTRGDW